MALKLCVLLVPVLLFVPAKSTSMKRCPDRSLCSENGTCCMLQSGRYSCCTMSNAVCCTTRNSCCPEHYVCDPASNLCAPGSIGYKLIPTTTTQTTTTTTRTTTTTTTATTTAAVSLPDVAALSDDVVQRCPAGDTYCFRANNTCCRFRGSSQATAGEVAFGCCPDKNAVCCSDQINCCPRGFACIRGTSSCVQTAPIGMSGELQPSRLLYGAPLESRHVQAMKVKSGRRR